MYPSPIERILKKNSRSTFHTDISLKKPTLKPSLLNITWLGLPRKLIVDKTSLISFLPSIKPEKRGLINFVTEPNSSKKDETSETVECSSITETNFSKRRG